MEKNRENEMIYFFTQIPFLAPAVMEKMLEAYYEKEDVIFQRFVDTYGTGKSDGGIEADRMTEHGEAHII